MKVTYDDKYDLLYIEIDDTATRVTNEDASDGVVLDVTEDGRIAGIEVLGASKRVRLDRLLPVTYATNG